MFQSINQNIGLIFKIFTSFQLRRREKCGQTKRGEHNVQQLPTRKRNTQCVIASNQEEKKNVVNKNANFMTIVFKHQKKPITNNASKLANSQLELVCKSTNTYNMSRRRIRGQELFNKFEPRIDKHNEHQHQAPIWKCY